MLEIVIPSNELYDERTNEFLIFKGTKLQLEHSLVSVSKWESKWHKPFLSRIEERTPEEVISYIQCMTITQNVNPLAYRCLTESNINEIMNYINDPMTATTIKHLNKKANNEIITAEIIYYYMIELNIPESWEKRHLNKLITLIEVISAKHEPQQKMSAKAIREQNAMLNRQRRAKYNSKG